LDHILNLKCLICGKEYRPDEVDYICPDHGNEGVLDVQYDYDLIRRRVSQGDLLHSTDYTIWRYKPLLPVQPDSPVPPLTVGWTPLYRAGRLAADLGIKHLWVKDDGRQPTASFKDRASAIVVARARQIDAQVVVTASTGNAGAALAGMAAATGHKAIIFAPRTAPPAKIAQLLVFGAQVILVDGTYDQAFDLTIEAAQEFGWYCRNTGFNPFTLEGKKTAAFEIWEYFVRQGNSRHWAEPLNIFVSVGDGNIISGLHKGFKDLEQLGWLTVSGMPMPRLFGVQAAGSAAIANAFNAGSETIIPVQSQTLADSISVDLPRDGVRAVRAARETGGRYLIVSDQDILQAISALGKVGIFAEPAGAAGYAGLMQALKNGVINPGETCLVINTGSGLKDVRAAMQAVTPAPVIEPTLSDLKKLL
jgi:threonine synthase